MIPVYRRLNVMFFLFLFIPKTFFAQVRFLMIYFTWQNFGREKWRQFYTVLLLFYFGTWLLCAKVASLESMLTCLDSSLE